MADFDAIIIGSGMSGGWVAKELAERGLKVAVIERGRNIEPSEDYKDSVDPWDTKHLDLTKIRNSFGSMIMKTLMKFLMDKPLIGGAAITKAVNPSCGRGRVTACLK